MPQQRAKEAGKAGYQPLRASSPPRYPSANLGRWVSPAPSRPGDRPLDLNLRVQQATVSRTIAPGQPAPGGRSKSKFISLPEEIDTDLKPTASLPPETTPNIFEDLDASQQELPPTIRGRITIYCIAESLDRKLLETQLLERGQAFLLEKFSDVLYGRYCDHGSGEPIGDVYYFEYGCIVFWGLTQKQEQDVLRNLVVPCEENPLHSREVEIDEFQFHYTANERPHVSNDTFTINHRLAGDHHIKLSISHALAQSTKLCVFEERVLEIVQSTKDLPETLATSGKVGLSRKEIAQLIGKVFIQKSAVNLLSTVLDTPEYFWSAPDAMQALYKKVTEYMELEERAETLNNRFQVLQGMLEMVRTYQNNSHASHLEWIVIWLVLLSACIGVFQCLGVLGIIGKFVLPKA